MSLLTSHLVEKVSAIIVLCIGLKSWKKKIAHFLYFVSAPPTIRLPRQYEDGLIFEKGETVRLKVSVVGQPVPSIMWFLNGIEIVPSLKYEIDYIDQTASLKVKNAQRNDRGEYQIQASNVLGEDLASILVTIASKLCRVMVAFCEKINNIQLLYVIVAGKISKICLNCFSGSQKSHKAPFFASSKMHEEKKVISENN